MPQFLLRYTNVRLILTLLIGYGQERRRRQGVIRNPARGYSDNDELREADDWPALRPSGAFLSTVLDLAKWDAMLYTDKILTLDSRRQMWTRLTLNDGNTYASGFGWHIGS